jgi:succinate-acetate transporter protein
MSLRAENREKIDRLLERDPNVTIFLRPIAAPAALGLAGFAGSTWITATWVARWWGDESSPTIFFPFVAFWGGLGQFIAGLFGYAARDTLITVIHVLWGSFWMSVGLLYLLVVSCLPDPLGGKGMSC